MMIWRRKVGESVVLGDDAVIVVTKVTPSDGSKFSGEVSLGFAVPPGVLTQRSESYLKQNERPPFPHFYRYVSKETGSVYGYGFEAPGEASTLSKGIRCEIVTGYDDITDLDRPVEIFLFRSEVEAEACVIGVTASGEVSNNLGVVKHLHGNLWAVMVDHINEYHTDPDIPNPSIRSYALPSPRVMAVIENSPRRKAG